MSNESYVKKPYLRDAIVELIMLIALTALFGFLFAKGNDEFKFYPYEGDSVTLKGIDEFFLAFTDGKIPDDNVEYMPWDKPFTISKQAYFYLGGYFWAAVFGGALLFCIGIGSVSQYIRFITRSNHYEDSYRFKDSFINNLLSVIASKPIIKQYIYLLFFFWNGAIGIFAFIWIPINFILGILENKK